MHTKYLIKTTTKGKIGTSDSNIKDYAVNGALHYARTVIKSHKYKACVIVGIAADSPKEIEQRVYYVYAANGEPKRMSNYDDLHFLVTEDAFKAFLKDAQLTNEEKHKILVRSQQDLFRDRKSVV